MKGGLAAGLFFVLPGAGFMLALSLICITLGKVPLVAALFFGLKCAVLVLVIEALLRVARRVALEGVVPWALAAAAFVSASQGSAKAGPPALLDALLPREPDRIARLTGSARRAGLLTLVLWIWPAALLMAEGRLFGDIAWFFSKMAVVTFGGYVVLAYVAQEAVGRYHWLSAGQMLAWLGLAETTPGPLILVLEFVGTLAGYSWGGVVGAC